MRRSSLLRYAAATALAVALGTGAAALGANDDSHSGGEGRPLPSVSSLSERDQDDLRNGRGWGLAKPAELNGVPGPLHVLELSQSLGLNAEQERAIRTLFDEMNGEARRLGSRLIELEAALDAGFAGRTIDEAALQAMLDEIGEVRGALRFAHLRAHLRTLPLLTAHQVAAYARLRGHAGATGTHGGESAPGAGHPHSHR